MTKNKTPVVKFLKDGGAGEEKLFLKSFLPRKKAKNKKTLFLGRRGRRPLQMCEHCAVIGRTH